MSLDQNQGLDCPSQERHEDTPPNIPVLFLSIIPSVKPTQLIPKFNQFSSPRKCFLGDSFPVSIISAEGLLSGPCLILTSVYTYEIRELSLLYTFSYYSFIPAFIGSREGSSVKIRPKAETRTTAASEQYFQRGFRLPKRNAVTRQRSNGQTSKEVCMS